MKRIIIATAVAGLALSVGPVLADGSSVITPTMVEHDVAGSSGGGILLPLILMVVIAAAVAGS